MTQPTHTAQPGHVTEPPVIYWAGPALMVAPERSPEPPVALLVMWRQLSGPPADGDPTGHLCDRGFARVPAPELEHLRRLPRLPGGTVRLSADGRELILSEDERTLFTGKLDAVSDSWRAAVDTGGLVVLVDGAPQPDTPGTDSDVNELAMARMTAACAAETLFGARIEVIQDGGPDPELDR
jgi:hypothetical protein